MQILIENGSSIFVVVSVHIVRMCFSFLGADKRIRNQDNKTPLDLTHDPNVRSLLEEKGLCSTGTFLLLLLLFVLVIFANYKQRSVEQNGNGNEEDDDSD